MLTLTPTNLNNLLICEDTTALERGQWRLARIVQWPVEKSALSLEDMLCAEQLLPPPSRTHPETIQNILESSTMKDKIQNVYLTIRDYSSFFTDPSIPIFLSQPHNYLLLFLSRLLNFSLVNSQTLPNIINNIIKKLRTRKEHTRALPRDTPKSLPTSAIWSLPKWNFFMSFIINKETWPLINILFNRAVFDIVNMFWFGVNAVHGYLITTVVFVEIFKAGFIWYFHLLSTF